MNKKGFTIVELLTVITILALLGTVGIISYNAIMNKVKVKYYKTIENNLLLAGSDYFSNNRSERPIDAYNMVDINNLIEDKYIEQIVDYEGNACSQGNVYISQNTSGLYNYEACLICNEYQTEGSYCSGDIDGAISISATSNGRSYNGLLSYNKVEWTNGNVDVTFKTTTNVDSFKITNNTNGVESYCNNISNNICTTTLSNSGSYSVEGYASSIAVADKKSFNVKIDKESPTFTINKDNFFIMDDSSLAYAYTNTVSNISDNNGIKEVKYRINKNNNTGNYQTIYNNYEINEVIGSALYSIDVSVIDLAGNVTTDTYNFTVAYNAKLRYADNTISNFQVVKGQNYGYLQSLPTTYDSTAITWHNDVQGIVDDNTIVTYNGSHELFTGINRTVTFVANGNEISKTTETCLDQGSGCSITSPTITASVNTPTVIGFSTSVNDHVSSWDETTAKVITSDATYYAQTTAEERTILINFDKNGATSLSKTSDICSIVATYNGVVQGTSCSITSPTITASTNTPTVIGFSTSIDDYVSSWNQNTSKTVSESETYYAQTSSTANTYSVTFNKNTATSFTYNDTTYTSNLNISCTSSIAYNGVLPASSCDIVTPTIIRENYIILGWATNKTTPSGFVLSSESLKLSSSNTGMTYYAITGFSGVQLCSLGGATEDSYDSNRCIYKGSNPNNYILFNSKNYRIISSEINGQIRIIYNDSSISSTTSYTFTSGNAYTYMNSGTYYNGLSTAAKNLIKTTAFNIGITDQHQQTNQYISDTISDEKTSTGNYLSGLPNVSDFLKASSNSGCTATTPWSTFNSSPYACTSSNWMYTSDAMHFINAHSSSRIKYLKSNKNISYDTSTVSAIIKPVHGMKPAVVLIDGTGTSSDPFIPYLSSSDFTVSVSAGSSSYTLPQTLTINITNNGTTFPTDCYSWDGDTWTSTGTLSVTEPGTYRAYVKDSAGVIISATIKMVKQTQYRYLDCPDANKVFSSWYYKSLTYVQSKSSCDYPQSVAEANYNTWAKRWDSASDDECADFGLTIPCYLCDEWSRSCTCSSYEGSLWTSWSATKPSNGPAREIESRTAIKAG